MKAAQKQTKKKREATQVYEIIHFFTALLCDVLYFGLCELENSSDSQLFRLRE